jgi:hypothetical protein
MSLELDALRGKQAQEIIENPIYAESFDAIRAEIIGQWEASRDAADREQLHQLLGLLSKAKTALESVMRSGEVASAELARKQTRAEVMQNTLRTRWGT